MDGVSGVSAVVTVAQLGFSLATTLNTYIADVRNGRGDIADLANEIEATVIHVEELDKVIQENSITGGWNENGLKIAKKCCTDCQAALNQLRIVFSKTGAAAIGDTVTRDSIDISLLNRLTWPSQKARLSILKQDLQRVKIDILIALNTYKAHVGTPQSAKDAAAERVAALWRSRIAAQRQLVSARDNPLHARAMDPAGGRVRDPTQRRARFADTPPSRSRSRSKQRSVPEDATSRRRQRRRYRSSSDSSNDSPPRSPIMEQQSQSLSDQPSPIQAPREGATQSQAQDQQSSPKPSLSSSPNKDDTHDKSDESHKLIGVEAGVPQAEPLLAFFLKSILGSGGSPSNKISGKDLLGQALSHPKEAGLLLNAISKMRPKSSKSLKDSPEVILQDPTMQSGIATTRAVSLLKISATEFQPLEIDYPASLLAKRLHHEQKSSRKGSPFGLLAWSTFPEIPPWCQQYIKQFLEHWNNDASFWSLLLLDPIYKKSKSRTARFRGRACKSPDDLVSVLVVFKYCKKLKEKPSQAARDEIIDSLAKRIAEPFSDWVGGAWERSKERRTRSRSRSSLSPSRSRSRSRARRRRGSDYVEYGTEPVVGGREYSRPGFASGENAYQTANTNTHAPSYNPVNGYNPSNIYQPPNSYQNANPYQNQESSYHPGDVIYPTASRYVSPPLANSYGVTDEYNPVIVNGDEDEINTNVPDEELTREVMARYTGVWQIDDNGVAHEEERVPLDGQRPPVASVVDEAFDMV